MCDNCRRHKRKLLKEIRLLTLREGEEYEEIVAAVNENGIPEWEENGELMDEDLVRSEIIEATIAQMIAIRAAFVAYYSDTHTEEGKLPPSFILGTWAARCLSVEIEQTQADNEQEMFNRLGMGRN